MRRVILSYSILFLCIVAMHSRALSGRYGEHKRIGDEAFYRVMQSLTGEEKQFLMDALLSPSSGNMDKTEPYYFLKLRGEDKESIKVTYGDLTGLSGDHAESPLELIEELNDKYSRLRQITILQHKYMDLYYFDAPDAEVARRDISYALMAIEDRSHFYNYNKDFVKQVGDFDIDILKRIVGLHDTHEFSKALYNVNSINKYITLHSFAIHTADAAARSLIVDRDTLAARRLLQLAVYINAYADHFIQDAFSSGHRVVNRTFLGSFTNNKYLHDFFGARGLRAVNLRGDSSWISYGDGYMNKKDWRSSMAIESDLAPNMEIAIQCDSVSIKELFNSFKEYAHRYAFGSYDQLGGSIVDSIDRSTAVTASLSGLVLNAIGQIFIPQSLQSATTSDYLKFDFFLKNFGALKYIPIPFGTEKETLLEAQKVATEKRDEENQSRLNDPAEMRKQAMVFDLAKKEVEQIPDASLTKQLSFLKYVKAHKGIGFSFLYGRHGETWSDFTRKRFSWGYAITLKGEITNFKYNNETLEHSNFVDWWVDFSFTNTFVKHDREFGPEFTFGVNNIFEIFISQAVPLDIGLLNEFGWHTLNHKTVFRWEPSVELRIAPHSTGLKLRATLLRSVDPHNFRLTLVYEVTEDLIRLTEIF